MCTMQGITLEYRMDQTVATADTPPVVLGRMPAPFAQSMGSALRHVALQLVSGVCLCQHVLQACSDKDCACLITLQAQVLA